MEMRRKLKSAGRMTAFAKSFKFGAPVGGGGANGSLRPGVGPAKIKVKTIAELREDALG